MSTPAQAVAAPTLMARLGIGAHVSLLVGTVALVSVLTAGYWSTRAYSTELRAHELHSFDMAGQIAEMATRSALAQQRDDLRLLSSSPVVSSLARALAAGGVDPHDGKSTVEDLRARLLRNYNAFVATRSAYTRAALEVGEYSVAIDVDPVTSNDAPPMEKVLETLDHALPADGVLIAVNDRNGQARYVLGAYRVDALKREGQPALLVLVQDLAPLYESLRGTLAGHPSTRLRLAQSVDDITIDRGHAVASPDESVTTRVEVPLDAGAITFWIIGDAQRVLASSARALVQSLIALLCVLAALLPVSLWVAARLTRPLSHIATAIADDPTHGASLSAVAPGAPREVHALARAVRQFIETIRERTESLQAVHASLAGRELHLRTVLEQAPVGILTIDEHGVIEQSNAVAERMLAGTVPAQLAALIARTAAAGKATDHADQLAPSLVLDNGLTIEASVGEYVLGATPRHVVILQDVSAWRLAERRLRESERFLVDGIESLPLPLFVKEANGLTYVMVNRSFEAFLGRNRESLIGRCDGDIFPEANAREFHRIDRQVLESHELRVVEAEEVTLESGEVRTVRMRKIPIFGDDGAPHYLLGVAEDVTDQLEAQRTLERNQSLLTAIVDHIPSALCVQDPDTLEYLLVNRDFEELAGRAGNLIVGAQPDVVWGSLAGQRLTNDARRFLASDTVEDRKTIESNRLDRHAFLELTRVKIQSRDGGTSHLLNIVTDVTEGQALQRATEAARQAAEQSNRAKSAFLASMSHEIRTPMNGIVGTIDLLLHSQLDSRQQRLTSIARESALSLLRIIDDILDFTKIEADKLDIELEPIQFERFIEGVAEGLWPLAVERGVALSCYVDRALPQTLQGDAVRLRQILINLIGNAIKFRDVGKVNPTVSVRIECGRDKQTLRVAVEDNGIGMAEETVQRLFQPFEQGDVSTTRKFGGSGLGLAISRRLVELMGGTIDVTSRDGEGTQFVVLLPLAAAEGALDAHEPSLSGVTVAMAVRDEWRDAIAAYLTAEGATVEPIEHFRARAAADLTRPLLIIDSQGRPERALQQSAVPAADAQIVLLLGDEPCSMSDQREVISLRCRPLLRSSLVHAVCCEAGRASPLVRGEPDRPMRLGAATAPTVEEAEANHSLILVAEDNEMNQAVIEEQLRQLGYACVIASNGVEALSVLQSRRIRLVLADCHMPEMDGYALTRAIRDHADASVRELPIIAFTANAFKGEAERCIAAGMNDYLAKPVQVLSLKTTIERWLSASPTVRYDPDALSRFVGNDLRTQRRIVDGFLASAGEVADTVRAHLDGSDFDVVKRAAHNLKSAARTVGAISLAEVCSAVEQLAGSSPVPATFPDAARQMLSLVDAARQKFVADLHT